MSEKELWLAPPEIEEIENLEDKWFYHDPLYNLCIQLSYLNSSNEESYGSVAIQTVGDVPTIIGLGWNMYMGGETNLKRQGYANHAEFQAAAVAEGIGYNLNDRKKQTCIYVAGRFVKEDMLFFSPENISFTCITCTTTLPKYFRNTSLAAPTVSKGWRHMDMQEAYFSSLFFNHNEFKRRDVLQTHAKASKLDISLDKSSIQDLIEKIKYFGFKIDKRIQKTLLGKYENLLTKKPSERRKIIEEMVDRKYKTLRGKKQASIVVFDNSIDKT